MVGRDEALRALRRELAGRDLGSASVLEVDDAAPVGFVLRVRAGRRIHPHDVVVAADERSLTHDHAWDEPLATDDAEQWAWGVAVWLEEQFGSGVLRWGPRVVLDDGIRAVDPRASLESRSGSGPPFPCQYAHQDVIEPLASHQRCFALSALDAEAALLVGVQSASVELQDAQRQSMQVEHLECVLEEEFDRLRAQTSAEEFRIVDANGQVGSGVLGDDVVDARCTDRPSGYLDDPPVWMLGESLEPARHLLARQRSVVRDDAIHALYLGVTAESQTIIDILVTRGAKHDARPDQARYGNTFAGHEDAPLTESPALACDRR